jgi:hypothetical protein
MRVLIALFAILVGVILNEVAFQSLGYIGVFITTTLYSAVVTRAFRRKPKRIFRAEFFRQTPE